MSKSTLDHYKKYFNLPHKRVLISRQRLIGAYLAGHNCSAKLFSKGQITPYYHIIAPDTHPTLYPESDVTDMFTRGFINNLDEVSQTFPALENHYILRPSRIDTIEAIVYGMIDTGRTECDTFRQRIALAMPYYKLNKSRAIRTIWQIAKGTTAEIYDLSSLLAKRLGITITDSEITIGILLRNYPTMPKIAIDALLYNCPAIPEITQQIYEDFLDEKVNFNSTDVDTLLQFITVFDELKQKSSAINE